MKAVTVCLMTYDNCDLLARFLGTLVRYSGFDGFVLLWDNNEDVEKQQRVRGLCSHWLGERGRVLGCGYNLFGPRMAAENRYPLQELLNVVGTAFVAFMQDDMAFAPSSSRFWDYLVETAWYKEVGLVAPCSNELYEGQQLHRVDLPERFVANHVHGSAVLARKDVLDEVGGWDPRLWHAIDSDLCLRLRRAGYKIVVDRRAYVHHDPAATMSKVETDLAAKILAWGELGRNQLIRKYGLASYHRYVLSGGHDANNAMLLYGWSWDSLAAELERVVPRWFPTNSVP